MGIPILWINRGIESMTDFPKALTAAKYSAKILVQVCLTPKRVMPDKGKQMCVVKKFLNKKLPNGFNEPEV